MTIRLLAESIFTKFTDAKNAKSQRSFDSLASGCPVSAS